tara:strand:+ start:2820 stop:3014 length:195 start_codon:yes stop_codon:yes gene_type:complete
MERKRLRDVDHPMTIYFYEGQWDRLQRIHRVLGMSVTEVVRRGVDHMLEKLEPALDSVEDVERR